jgi:hypothetical protein
MANRVEQARPFDCALVLASQVAESLGAAVEAEPMLASAETLSSTA